jgi:hypothetical protein
LKLLILLGFAGLSPFAKSGRLGIQWLVLVASCARFTNHQKLNRRTICQTFKSYVRGLLTREQGAEVSDPA